MFTASGKAVHAGIGLAAQWRGRVALSLSLPLGLSCVELGGGEKMSYIYVIKNLFLL